MNYFQKQRSLQDDAKKILEDLRLISFLRKKGSVHISGSFALDLMSWEDIDIVVNGDQNVNSYLETIQYIFKQKNVYSMNVQDFRKSIFANRPQGLYCGVTYLVKPKTFWKVDIWFFKKEDNSDVDLIKDIKLKLNEKNRTIILKIKNEMRKEVWGKKISGLEVYKAVLDEGIQNTKDFKDIVFKN